MAIQKYSGEKAIKEKINQLFQYRKLTDLLQISHLNKNKVFQDCLVELQYRIYVLDAYLEGKWELDASELRALWTDIRKALEPLNHPDAEAKALLKEIKAYESIEKNCRKGNWPTGVSFKKFYLTKSCDVRLIRHLIYEAYPELSQMWKENAWAYYDRITEINDDLTDVREDLTTYNGNRFLISIIRKGIPKTKKQYRKYLLKIISKAKAYFKEHPDQSEHKQLFQWTMLRSQETLELLDKVINTTEPDVYASSLLLKHMD